MHPPRHPGPPHPGHHHEQAGEEEEQRPVHPHQGLARLPAAHRHDQRRAGQRGPGERKAQQEARRHREERRQRLPQERPVERRAGQVPAGERPPRQHPPEHPVKQPRRQQRRGRRRQEQRPREASVADARERPHDHVLRVAGEGGGAPGVGAEGGGEQVGEGGQLGVVHDAQHQRRHHEADGVVHQHGGQGARRQGEPPQEGPRRPHRGDHLPAGPAEEAGLPQVGGEHHHPQEQAHRVAVHGFAGLGGGEHPRRHHQHRPEQRRRRAVEREPGEPAAGHGQIGEGEDDQGGRHHGWF